MRYLWIVLIAFLASPAAAQEVRDCNDRVNGGLIIDPNTMSGRAYANGEVTIGVVHDGRSNSTDSLFVVVFAPDADAPGQKACRMIGRGEMRGYANVRLEVAEANYTAADGLTVQIPARIYLKEEAFSNTTVLSVNVNRATNEITVTQELGNE